MLIVSPHLERVMILIQRMYLEPGLQVMPLTWLIQSIVMIGGTEAHMSTDHIVIVIVPSKDILIANLLKSGDATVKPKTPWRISHSMGRSPLQRHMSSSHINLFSCYFSTLSVCIVCGSCTRGICCFFMWCKCCLLRIIFGNWLWLWGLTFYAWHPFVDDLCCVITFIYSPHTISLHIYWPYTDIIIDFVLCVIWIQ